MPVGDEILGRLKKQYSVEAKEYVSLFAYLRSRDPFQVLVATILSQNTTDKASLEALNSLMKKVGLTPQAILEAGKRRVQEAIKRAGMYRSKARFIIESSRIIMDKYGGSLRSLLEGDAETVRMRLEALPGVGGKTADVLLATMGIVDTIPIDTHVRRVSTRLGLIEDGMSYEEARKRLEEVFTIGSRHLAHLLLIAHGRKICRARNPLCTDCTLRDLCRYYRETKSLLSGAA
ncbi:MAG: endonuclease III [Nitrososphaerota archaeon]|nr:endonuclease III [Candidatus Calditenuaceae archaeon]MDW8073782.1 endonuclease III [Nitrososphaerota archaeon]